VPDDRRNSIQTIPSTTDQPFEEISSLSQRIDAVNRTESQAALRNSYAGRIGTYLEGVSRWCGFEWRTNVALLAGFPAKELIISTLGTAYSLGEASQEEEISLSRRLAEDPDWNRLRAFALIVFIMLYAPCLATVTCIVKEAGALKWGLFSLAFNTAVAFLLAVLIYQGGLLLGLGS
jgi:ferrous iron transport protein B